MNAISFSSLVFMGILMTSAPLWAQADGPGSKASPTQPQQKKSQFNSKIYEEEKTESSFTAKVKVIREIQDETQVFFQDIKGFYILNMSSPNAGSWQNLLTASQTKKFPVQVSVNPDSRQILNVVRNHEDP